jgi:hypothetical protein
MGSPLCALSSCTAGWPLAPTVGGLNIDKLVVGAKKWPMLPEFKGRRGTSVVGLYSPQRHLYHHQHQPQHQHPHSTCHIFPLTEEDFIVFLENISARSHVSQDDPVVTRRALFADAT